MSKLKDKLNQIYHQENQDHDGQQDENPEIRKQLNRLYRNRKNKIKSRQEQRPNFKRLINEIDGKFIKEDEQEVILVADQFNMLDKYGEIDLREIYNYTQKDYDQYLHIKNIKYPEQLLFIDTETTGLAGGTGTIAFLVGIGWIEKEVFHLQQYFLPEFKSEGLMLKKIANKIENFTALVSYNGKSFDIPLLTSRYLLNKQKPILENYPHIDLLHPNRSLWRYSSENCKLQTIEGDKIGLYREDDIPGELIPAVYFNYINNRGKLQQVVNIFEHNRLDIISMLANLICLFQSFKHSGPSKNPLEDFAKGRHFKKRKEIKRSIKHYQNVLQSDITENRRFKTLMELAGVYKKEKNYEKAVPLWEQAADMDFPAVKPLVELAKYYEHKVKDFQKAIQLTEVALDIVDEEDVTTLAKLNKRLKRVQRKNKKRDK
ncbi:MAG: ribonuclease H-like domain-containing protein [Candidatus Marinimicrobia bacterium]|nr:ribonuclease H-like domain-containing protein [Candidatus Neomarinimicrobiota bacterium]